MSYPKFGRNVDCGLFYLSELSIVHDLKKQSVSIVSIVDADVLIVSIVPNVQALVGVYDPKMFWKYLEIRYTAKPRAKGFHGTVKLPRLYWFVKVVTACEPTKTL